MFHNNGKMIDVSIRMIDQAVIRGALMKGQNATIEAILSKDTPFLEFVSQQGQRKFIAKHQIAYVEPVEPLRKPELPKADSRFMDAFTMLGVSKSCTLDEAKTAYHARAKVYHPDAYSGLHLPVEIDQYVNDMFRQINTAFTEVRNQIESTKAA